MSATSLFWFPDEQETLTFMKTYMPNFIDSLGYRKWHYVNGFTKNCEYQSIEYKTDKLLMRLLETSVFEFQNKYYANCKLPVFSPNTKRIVLDKKPTIFLYWHQGKDKLPDLQQLCYNRLLQKCSKNFNILLLDKDTISDYIDIPKFMTDLMENKKMWLQHYVDYIRMCLLAKYEGIWFDATIFVRDNLEKVNFNYIFWSVKCHSMFRNTWADGVIPEMNECQIYAMSGTTNYFYECMKTLIEYHFKTFGIAYSYYMMYYIANYLLTTNPYISGMFKVLQYNNEDVECFANNRHLDIDDIQRLWNTTKDTHFYKLIKYKTTDNNDAAYKVYSLLKEIYEGGK